MRRISIQHQLTFPEGHVPLMFVLEPRRNFRISIGKEKVYLRAPSRTSKRKMVELLDWAHEWLTGQFHIKPGLKDRFFRTFIRDGMLITTSYDTFVTSIVFQERKMMSCKKRGERIELIIPEHLPLTGRQDLIRKGIQSVLTRHYQSFFTKKTIHWHQKAFYDEKPLAKIRLRYMYSKWGSCSQDGKVALSTRLCFAPEDILDYVIVHELCHLKHLDHSKRYWESVAAVVPEYQECERWLKKHGERCDF